LQVAIARGEPLGGLPQQAHQGNAGGAGNLLGEGLEGIVNPREGPVDGADLVLGIDQGDPLVALGLADP